MDRGFECAQCGHGPMRKTTHVDRNLGLQALGIVLFIGGVLLLGAGPIGIVAGVALMVGSARLGYRRRKVWLCPHCGSLVDRVEVARRNVWRPIAGGAFAVIALVMVALFSDDRPALSDDVLVNEVSAPSVQETGHESVSVDTMEQSDFRLHEHQPTSRSGDDVPSAARPVDPDPYSPERRFNVAATHDENAQETPFDLVALFVEYNAYRARQGEKLLEREDFVSRLQRSETFRFPRWTEDGMAEVVVFYWEAY